VSDRARERLVERPSSWYLDLNLIAGYVASGTGRTYHHTAPVSMVTALHAGLGVLLEEGLVASWERHRACGTLLQDGLERLGLELVAPVSHRLPQLTTVRVPDGVDEAAVRSRLREGFGIEIGAGAGQLAGKVWRIGCMGHTARPRNVALVLAALGEVLGR
jgi:alanine-glyoxylate transaminase/serine-glyoxylate transaminase/serine-pyruvate transaminase